MHNYMEYPDSPRTVVKSLRDSTSCLRKCFYYYCSYPVYCRNTLQDVSESHPIRIVTGVKRYYDETADDYAESNCRNCAIYCVYHLFAADYLARRYGPYDD